MGFLLCLNLALTTEHHTNPLTNQMEALFLYVLLATITNFYPIGIVMDNVMAKEENSFERIWEHVDGHYKGTCQQRPIVIEINANNNSAYSTQTYGSLSYGGKVFSLVCIETGTNNQFELRIKRPSNPALLGEYLAWRAKLTVSQDGERLSIDVLSSLSTVEKIKYSLPEQGVSFTLHRGNNKYEVNTKASNKKCFSTKTVFYGENAQKYMTYVFLPDGTCSSDGGINVDGIEGEWTRGHADGYYRVEYSERYHATMIYIIWEGDIHEDIQLMTNDTEMWLGNLICVRQLF